MIEPKLLLDELGRLVELTVDHQLVQWQDEDRRKSEIGVVVDIRGERVEIPLFVPVTVSGQPGPIQVRLTLEIVE